MQPTFTQLTVIQPADNSRRNQAVDAAKGIGILLVIYGHTIKGTDFRVFLYSFHMALFFIVSGLFFRPELYTSWQDMITRTARTLLWPYVVFYVLSYSYWLSVERLLRPGGDQIPWYEPLVGLFLATDVQHYMNPNGALWFLVGLFMAQVALYGLLRTVLHNGLRMLALCLALATGIWLAQFQQLVLPFSLKSAFVALFFVGLGYLIRELDYTPQQRSGKLLATLTGLSMCYWLSINNELIDIDHGHYGNPLRFVGAALLGVWGCLCGASFLQGAPILTYFGLNSLIAFGLSEPIKRLSIGLVSRLSHYSVDEVRQSVELSVIVLLLTLLLLVPVIYLFNNQLSRLIGRKRRRSATPIKAE
jgi:fucose 4-O-acetylase-like acetyltransferase